MGRTIKSFFLLVVLFLTIDNVCADTLKNNLWYLRAGVGVTDIEYRYPNHSVLKEQSSAYHFGAGVKFFQHFAIEANYYDLGIAKDDVELGVVQGSNLITTDSLHIELFSLGLVGRLPIGESVSLIGKLGFGQWSSQEDISNASDNDSGTTIIPSFGVAFDVSKHFLVEADLILFDIAPNHFSSKSEVDIGVWSIGVQYIF